MKVNVKSAGSSRRASENLAYVTPDMFDECIKCGYVPLSENAEVQACINQISELISSMTIHLINNGKLGDERIKGGLSRFIDIEPHKFMTRKTWMSVIVNTLLTKGNSVVLPEFDSKGNFNSLNPVPDEAVNFVKDGFGYKVMIYGVEYDPSDVLHFPINPRQPTPWKGNSYNVQLKPLVENISQAGKTKNSFMSSKWKPSLVVRVNSDSEKLSSSKGREEIRKQYLSETEAGAPWMIPAEQLDVKEVRPLSLNDLAINEAVTLDKKTVAAILGVPPFVVGVGSFNREEWNNFISTKIKHLCNIIEQELTRKLLINSNWYFRFNYRSLYSYDLETLSTVGANLYTRGIVTGNEVRDSIGYNPMEGLNDLVILENYIPQGMIGDQKKLIKGGDDNATEDT